MFPECAEALLPRSRGLAPGKPLLVVPHIQTFHEHRQKAGIPDQDERGRHADFHSLRYTFCTWLAEAEPIQVVQRFMRHSTIKLTADLSNDLGLEDVRAERWHLRPLRPTAGQDKPGGRQAG
ncbi:MAG: tyrosine-type recombinase/integrase [Gemmataceae bacterium]|nr:tyrosine-type recombinase/integrase [Gemmataceae bacterium]